MHRQADILADLSPSDTLSLRNAAVSVQTHSEHPRLSLRLYASLCAVYTASVPLASYVRNKREERRRFKQTAIQLAKTMPMSGFEPETHACCDDIATSA